MLKFEQRVFDIDIKHGYFFAAEGGVINVYRLDGILGKGGVVHAKPVRTLGADDGIHWMKVSVDLDDERTLWIAAVGYQMNSYNIVLGFWQDGDFVRLLDSGHLRQVHDLQWLWL